MLPPPPPPPFVYGSLGCWLSLGREEEVGVSSSSGGGGSLGQPLSLLPLLIRSRLFISMHDGQVLQCAHARVADGTQGPGVRVRVAPAKKGWWFLECVGRGHKQPGSLKVVKKTLS